MTTALVSGSWEQFAAISKKAIAEARFGIFA
jgi:hypothetical protein